MTARNGAAALAKRVRAGEFITAPGVYELTLDAFGVAFLAGCTMFLVRRLRAGGEVGAPPGDRPIFGRTPADVALLVLLIAIGVTGYVVEGLRIILADTPLPGLSPVGYIVAQLFRGAGADATRASRTASTAAQSRPG